MAKRKRMAKANGRAQSVDARTVLERTAKQLEWLATSRSPSATRVVGTPAKRRAHEEAAKLVREVIDKMKPPEARAPVDGIALTRSEAGAMLRDVSGPRSMLWEKLGRPVGPSNPAAHTTGKRVAAGGAR